MSDFIRLSQDGLNRALAEILCPRIEPILGDRGPGHCMRMTDLDDAVMESVCEALRKESADRNVFILAGQGDKDRPYRISSTKLVELRNPDAEGGLRKPLLVFLPASLRTSAEDSFGVATFEELSFTGLYAELLGALLDRVPRALIIVWPKT